MDISWIVETVRMVVAVHRCISNDFDGYQKFSHQLFQGQNGNKYAHVVNICGNSILFPLHYTLVRLSYFSLFWCFIFWNQFLNSYFRLSCFCLTLHFYIFITATVFGATMLSTERKSVKMTTFTHAFVFTYHTKKRGEQIERIGNIVNEHTLCYFWCQRKQCFYAHTFSFLLSNLRHCIYGLLSTTMNLQQYDPFLFWKKKLLSEKTSFSILTTLIDSIIRKLLTFLRICFSRRIMNAQHLCTLL